ncbi:MAG: NAD kinase, partial [Bacteroidaceae bacterium]
MEDITLLGGKIVVEKDFADFLEKAGSLHGLAPLRLPSSEIEADFAVSMGGDGTFLETARQIGEKQIPIIGINTGRLGFISDLMPNDASAFFKDLINGDYEIERRTLLNASFSVCEGWQSFCALNEVAVLKHDESSMIDITTHVDGKYLTTYRADGLVVSTPTGSTGYSLSVGGPIVAPDSKSIIISPIAAHSLAVRPFIMNDDVKILLEIKSRSKNFMIAIDGKSKSLSDSVKIEICKASYTIGIVRQKQHSFFDTLRNKLLWGADRR